jgi:hypothetical protein
MILKVEKTLVIGEIEIRNCDRSIYWKGQASEGMLETLGQRGVAFFRAKRMPDGMLNLMRQVPDRAW